MTEKRTILLIGKTGNGKSTLANVLTGTNNFREVDGGASGTTEVQIEKFESDNITYRVIDTVGIGDTGLSKEETLNRLKGAEHIICNGLSQILFVTSDRFTKEEIDTFNLLRETIFDANVGKYVTVVYTKFPNFCDDASCEKNIQRMKENSKFTEIFNSCNGFIHIDNPLIKMIGSGKKIESQIAFHKEDREVSRGKLLKHLKNCQEIYRPELLAKFKKMIGEFDSNVKKINQEINSNHGIFASNIEQIEEFIAKRERIIKEIKEYETKIISIKNKNVNPVINSSIRVLSTLNVINTDLKKYESLQEDLKKEDKKNVEKLSQSWEKLIYASKNFKEKKLNGKKGILSQFNSSEYKNQEIDKEKIKKVETVIEKAQILQIEPSKS